MTALYAVYLVLMVAVVMLGIGIWSKLLWVSIVSGVCWLTCGYYFVSTGTDLFVDGFGIICIFAGIGAIAMPFVLADRRKPELPPVEPRDRIKEIDTELEYYRNARRRLR